MRNLSYRAGITCATDRRYLIITVVVVVIITIVIIIYCLDGEEG